MNLTAVGSFRAEGDFDLTGCPPDLSKRGIKPGFESYVPPGWVALTFTLLPDSYTVQEIRLMRVFPRRPIPGTDLQRSSLINDGMGAAVYRSWANANVTFRNAVSI